MLASKTRTTIVPVTINGSGKILPKGAWRLRAGVVDVRVNDPIPTADHRPGKLRALAAEVERIIENDLSRDGERPAETTTRAEDRVAPGAAPERKIG